MSREAFEKWISQPPYEKDITKYPDDPEFAAWPKCYRDISVQIAWDAWQAAKADAVPVVPEGIPDLAIFLASVWRQVDDFIYANCTGDQLMQYPVIQGTHNQLQLLRVATLPYDKQQVARGVQALLSASHNPTLSTKPNQ